jgi:acyl-CoA thioester hydrolase
MSRERASAAPAASPTRPNEYVVEVPIRFSDIDRFGHVNHARYLTYCEDHRTSMLPELQRDTGSCWDDAGFVVARVECEYHGPLSLDDGAVDVAFSVDRIGRTSITVHYGIRRAAYQQEVASLREVLVLVEHGRPRAVGDEERAWLQRYATDI